MTETFYDALGVSKDADESEIKTAYREKVKQYHPDVSDEPDAEEQFKKIQKAKEVLTDEEKRQAYDQLGHERFEQAEKRGGTGGGGAGGMGGGGPFGGMGGGGGQGTGGMGDIFDQFFGGGGGRGGPQAGQDLRTRLEITLEEAYEGVSKQVSVRRPETCPDCGGDGHPEDADVRTCPECNGQGQTTQVQQTPFGRMQTSQQCRRCGGDGELYSETCSTCSGQGQIRQQATLTVDVPAGIQSGQTLRMDGEGAPGDPRAPNGDLLIEVAVEDHPDFERDGADLHHDFAISFPQAVFGDTVQVPTLDGTSEFDIPAGTQSGERFRLRNKGMPRLRGRRKGDLYVTVQVVTPDSLNEEQREALEAFAEAGGEEVDVEQGFFEKIKSSF
ncbi:molecular chaperone DnaJ [Halocalculus aciditolerans]|uniref:Chaperone protein DnaJ n=1 Tax=Halocalculus aciditolerans TaxID=1383812 RepID=A0A830FJQ3_9EURY|nr:molecular chaperone DnaJ [Halocalculus aciditolerans]GGL62128.1 molecular chaperone DnaJ [Halocalculus aciditolerans]